MSNTPAQPQSPSWVAHAIGWHVYPLGFVGAPIRPEQKITHSTSRHTMDDLVQWLDYAQQLGLNAIQLGPVFDSVSHGYDTLDYYRIDPRLGDEEACTRFLEAAHQRGFKVLFDGVFNHLSSQASLFQEALQQPESDAAQLFAIDRSDPDNPIAPCFEGHEDLVEFDHASEATAKFVTDILDYWLARGVDGWRMDAAYSLPAEFWAKVLPPLREKYPEAYFYGEVIHGDYPQIVQASTLDSVTEYELWKAVWSSLKEGNFFELEWTLRRHNEFLDTFVPVTFIGNHDVTRIATTVGADKAVLALTVLLTVGGTPLIYYGDEQAYTGAKEERLGGDDQVRPVMPEHPDELADLGQWMYEAHQQLIAIRRQYPWLHTARVAVDHLENEHLVYTVSAHDGSHAEQGSDKPRQLQVELKISGAQGTPEAIVRVPGQSDTLFHRA